jgi:cysteine synthase A
MKVVDEIVQLSNKELLDMAKRLAREGGILSWISSSAVVVAAVKIARRRANIGELVVVLCSAVEGYLSTGFSTGLFHENECRRL